MATRKNGGTFNEEVRQEYIKHMLGRFLQRRFDDAFMRDIGNFRYEVVVDYDFTKMAHYVRVRTDRYEMALLVAEDRMFEVANKDDWMQYQLERMEPMMDTLMFCEWFYAGLPDEDRTVFKQHLAPLIKQVTYRPPRQTFSGMRQVYGPLTIEPHKIGHDWLAIVRFENGATRREQICNIHEDIETWFSMLLMAADNRNLTMNAAM